MGRGRRAGSVQLNEVANVFSVAAGGVVIMGASYAFWEYSIARWLRERRSIQHLKDALDRGVDRGRRTVMQLMRKLSLMEQQRLDAEFRSRRIQPSVAVDPHSGRARAILFQHRDRRTQDDAISDDEADAVIGGEA
jgi:hypothetical protein